jgi:CBS domain-containing protein
MKHPTVASIMHASPLTITQRDDLAAAQALMERAGVRQLPVVESGVLIGMLSERDLHEHTGYLERTKVDAAMSSAPATVAPTDSAVQAARLLLERKINALPVVEGTQLLGIVSRSDLLRLLVDVLAGD